MNSKDGTLPSWAWIWLPIAALAVELGFRMLNEPVYRIFWQSELGPVETGTVVVLLSGILAGLMALQKVGKLPTRWLTGWLILAIVGSIYFCGEEASWGQHWMGWETPQAMSNLNDQDETNLHNTSSWLDQKPRLLLELGILVGSLLYPLYLWLRQRAWPSDPADVHYWIWPDRQLLPTALLAMAVVLPQRFEKLLGWPVPYPLDIRASETQEFYFALFISLYLYSFQKRLHAK